MLTNGQFDLSDAKETVALPSTTDVASFTDTNLSDTASSFTATIDWGDGLTTTGTVVGSNGHFTVEGGHTYSDENQFPALVTVTADSSQLLIAGTVPVADADVFSNLHGTTISYTPNQPLTNVTVATFSDSNTVNAASDFTAQIDWGDGTTTAGTVQGSNGSFSIVGSHTYTAPGLNTISVAFADDAPDAASGFVSGSAVSGFGGAVTFTSATEGTANSGVTVADFADTSPGTHVFSDYTANIDWGDGTTTPGTVSGSGQSFTVTGSHTYVDEEGNEITGDSPLMKVSIKRTSDNVSITASGTVLVSDTPPTMASKTIDASPSQALTNVTVATFTDANQFDVASDFTATINWGDGSDLDTVTASVSGSNGAFTVTGSHTYTTNGQYNVAVSILEDIPNPAQTGAVTSTAVIGLAPGQLSSITVGEGVLLSGQQVATFKDGNTSDTALDFSASIDWGDGQTTPGTIAGASGSFTVTGTHSYGDEGDEPVVVSVRRTADGETATIAGTATVTESDALAVTANNISGNPGQPFNNIQVASFSTTFLGNVAGDFTATIDWGDGATSAGTVSGSNGSFIVTGSHTYTAGGTDTLKVTVADDAPGTATTTGTSTATINLAGQMVLANAAEGTALPNNTPVATFSDSNGGDMAASFTATIAWGDGVTSAGTVSGGAGTFTVSGGHTYADEGNDTAKVTLTHTADQATSTVSGSVAVAEADILTPHGTTIAPNANQSFIGTLATFSDSDTANVPSDFTATVDWGDGATTVGTVSGGAGTVTVSGSHTYAAGGQDTVKVTLTDDAPGTASATATTTASVRSLSGQMALNAATESMALASNTKVATFSDTNTSDTAGDFTATINWGDGTTTTGTVSGGAGAFTVSGGHTYADEGSDQASVTLTHTSDQLQSTASGTIAVGEGDVLAGQGTTIAPTAHQAFAGTVATFTDSDSDNVAGDFTAAIDWGDGQTTVGTVSGPNGSFTVSGSHTYVAGGQDSVKVTLTDDAPGTASATATTTATVRTLSGQMVLMSATEATALPNSTAVATFSDSNTSDAASDFTAAINWGDGATTPGTVVGSGGSFTVEGGHTYADEGSDPASVTLTHTADQLQSTASGTIAVGEGDVLAGQGTTITATARQAFAGAVATFSDSDTANVAGDFTAAIDWGDGQTTAGTVSGANASFTVSGSHTYAAGGQDTVKVTLADDVPGTASATATTTATVSPGLTNPFDFNGDIISDLVFQNEGFNAGANAGTPRIWLWNGTAVTSDVTFPNPGASWHIVTSRDVNGDGNADLIWQNNDGTPGIWLMNGTTPTAEVGLTNPGPSWHLVASGDTNGDGKSDLIWQNTDGTLGVWLMNGTTLIAEAGIGNAGANWKVVSTADLNADNRDDILLQNTVNGDLMIDLMNGATITSTKTISVGDPSWHAVSTGEFNGQAEIAWQNNDGTPGIWLMNGTTPGAETALSNPGPGWQLISVDHFTANGQADLLFQNTNGALQLWEMNGTSVAAMVNLPNPGTGWQSENGHPFAASGSSAAAAFNAPDPGSGALHLSAPDATVTGGPGSPQNLPFASLHVSFGGA